MCVRDTFINRIWLCFAVYYSDNVKLSVVDTFSHHVRQRQHVTHRNTDALCVFHCYSHCILNSV